MAKKDNNDETPIEFDIPKWGTRGPRIPSPVNQPNWKYKYPVTNSKPGISEKVFIATVAIIEFFLVIKLLQFENLQLSFYIFTVFWSLFTLISLIRYVHRESHSNKYDESIDNTIPPKKSKEKKIPKRRKDFK